MKNIKMVKNNFKVIWLLTAFLSMNSFAASQQQAIDPYSQCVDETIQELKLGNINNAVVEI